MAAAIEAGLQQRVGKWCEGAGTVDRDGLILKRRPTRIHIRDIRTQAALSGAKGPGK
jgi:hypothetical protein